MQYRIYDVKNGKYYDEEDLDNTKTYVDKYGNLYFVAVKSLIIVNEQDYIVEYWSGLYDCNGIAIYNNDILISDSWGSNPLKVILDDGGFFLVPLDYNENNILLNSSLLRGYYGLHEAKIINTIHNYL